MGIIEDIGQGPVCLDTCIFIYFIEEHSNFIEVISKIFELIDKGKFEAVTSGITLAETLVIPFKKKDFKLADQYERILTNSFGIKLCDISNDVLRQAAFIRANYNIKMPDALQLAVAKIHNCTCLITNDRKLPQIGDIKIIQLSS